MTEIQPATEELLTAIEAMRPNEGWRGPVLGAFQNAHDRSVSRHLAYLAVFRVACDPEATPRDLGQLFRDPTVKNPVKPGEPGEEYEQLRARFAPRKEPDAA